MIATTAEAQAPPRERFLRQMHDHGDKSVTILLVDDNGPLRDVTARLLGMAGYHVVTAASADEAIRILESEAPVDLLLSDVIMPGTMDGYGLARCAAVSSRRIGVLLVSAFAHTPPAHDAGLANLPLLRKPYRARELLSAIETVLATVQQPAP
ncbi:protein of unknown function [Rhodovastum atsumiense]|nr:response regulator [Rhodovastum atsumiense]CAH2604731.1 protein of unknown function [Rhodovastum atsumiense]